MAHSASRGGGASAAGMGGGDSGAAPGRAAAGKPVDYQRVIKLFTNKHTEALTDRQVSAVRRVARKNQDGYFIKDLPALEQLLKLLAGRVEGGVEDFREPLGALVALAGKPFKRSRSHEEFRSLDAITSFVRALADLLSISDPPLQVSVALSLREIVRGYLPVGQRRAPDDPVRTYNLELVTRAGVADMVVARFAAEMDELMTYDANQDNKIDAEEMHNAVVDNDMDRTNDDEAFDAAKAETMVHEGVIVRPPYLLGLLVTLVWDLSSHQPSSRQLVLQGTPQLLVQLLAVVSDHREQVVYLAVEALWNMLEHSKSDLAHGDICLTLRSLLKKHRAANAAYLLGNESSVVCLTSLFERLLHSGFKRADKTLRNEILIVASLVAERTSSVPLFVNSGFLSLLLEYSVAAEMELPVDANPRNFATSDPVDLDFKQLAWSLVGQLCAVDDGAMARTRESLFLQTLMLYLNPTTAHGNRYLAIWAPTQRRALDLLAARLLQQLVPACRDQFDAHDGSLIALNHIRAHSSILVTPTHADDDAAGSGDDAATALGEDESMDAPVVDDTDDDVDRQFGALNVLVAACHSEQVRTALGDAGAVEDLLALLSRINAIVPPPAEVAPTATVTAATATPSALSAGILVESVFTVLSLLCAGNHEDNQTRFRRAGGVGVLLSWLHYDPEDAVAKPMAIIPVVATLWEAVVGNRRSEARFIVEEGVVALFDLVEACPPMARPQVLGCLADLCRNPKAHTYANAWRSDAGRDAAVMLLSMWHAEEQRLGVVRDPTGVIADASEPLDKAVPLTGADIAKAEVAAAAGRGPPSPSAAGAGGNAGAGAGAGGDGSGGSPRDAQPAFERLRRALKASKLWTQVESEEPGAKVRKAAMANDLRPKIFSLLSALGMDYLDAEQQPDYSELEWQHKLAFCVASRYFQFREGHLWLDITRDFAKERVALIRADLLQVEKELETSYSLACAAQHAQHVVVSAQQDAAREDDERFFETVRMQKAGEEAAYILQQQQGPLARAKARLARSRAARA